jgi:hypothetical protein
MPYAYWTPEPEDTPSAPPAALAQPREMTPVEKAWAEMTPAERAAVWGSLGSALTSLALLGFLAIIVLLLLF